MSLSRLTAGLATLLIALCCASHAFPPFPPEAELRIAFITQTLMRDGALSTNRSVSALLHARKAAPAGAAALLELPASLGVPGPLQIAMINVVGRDEPRGLDAVVYWGSQSAIPLGQPRVRKARAAGLVRFREGASGLADPVRLTAIGAAATAKGVYRVRLGYVGEGSVTVTEAQEFLAPVQVVAPADGRVDFSRPIEIAWSPMPHAVAWCVTATARGGDGRTVLWESAWRADAWALEGVEWGLRNHKLLPASQTSVILAPGIFMGGPVQVSVTAISAAASGRGAVRPTAWAQSSTTFELRGR